MRSTFLMEERKRLINKKIKNHKFQKGPSQGLNQGIIPLYYFFTGKTNGVEVS